MSKYITVASLITLHVLQLLKPLSDYVQTLKSVSNMWLTHLIGLFSSPL